MFAGTSKELWWECNKGHQYQATGSNRSAAGSNCPVCLGRKVPPGVNDFATLHPHLAKMWGGEPLDPRTLGVSSDANVDWKCSNRHRWRTSVQRMVAGYTCLHCPKERVYDGRSIAEARPELMAEWDYTANGRLTHQSVTIGSSRMVHWLCPKGALL